ncbi:hypothetical protein [Ochrobactrum sp. S1502_03]|uniref:hypothetical protein n=1 Tax=Ochrobactrum sp. S1502_03 TaxID=3108451 RepID=UPI0037C7797A
MSEQAQGAGAPISIDIAGAVAALEGNPDLVNHLQELAFGPLAAQQIAVRDEIIEELIEALYRLSNECKLAGLASQTGFDCWIAFADKTLAKARGEA